MTDESKFKQEYRFGIVLYGGVSLAVYINGVCQELVSMVRGGSERHGDAFAERLTPHSTEPVFRVAAMIDSDADYDSDEFLEWFDGVMETLESGASVTGDPIRKFSIDILSGTSAGGLNSIFLAKSLVYGAGLEELKRLWCDEADLDRLLEDEESYEHHRKRYLRHGNAVMTEEPSSLLSGDLMYLKLFDALEKMHDTTGSDTTGGLVDALDCFLTTTDLRGSLFPLRLSDTEEVDEAHHRTVFHFVKGSAVATGGERNDFEREAHAALAFAGRATSAFPLAFEPAQIRQVDEGLATWIGREPSWDYLAEEEFLSARTRPRGQGDWKWDLGFRWFSDGGDMDNKPFSYVLGPLARRRAEIPVKRHLLYVEPDPEDPASRHLKGLGRPTVKEAVFDAISLGRYEAIRADIESIHQRNERVEQLKSSITEQVLNQRAARRHSVSTESWISQSRDTALEAPNGPRELAFEHFRTRLVAAEMGDLLAAIADVPRDSGDGQRLRGHTTDYVERTWLSNDARGRGEGMGHRDFLYRFDLSYRLRKTVFIDQVVAGIQENFNDAEFVAKLGLDETPTFDDLRKVRREVNRIYNHLRTIGRHLRSGRPEGAFAHRAESLSDDERRDPRLQVASAELKSWGESDVPSRLRAVSDSDANQDDLDRLFGDLSGDISRILQPWFQMIETQAKELFGGCGKFGEFLFDIWRNYSVYDSLILPNWETAQGELANIDVVRVSPQDATSLVQVTKVPGHEVDKLGGNAFAHFGAFLSREWRQNDILWGRLDACERLLMTVLPGDELGEVRARLIAEAQRRIFLSESEAVTQLPSLSVGHRADTTEPEHINCRPDDPDAVREFLKTDFAISRKLPTRPNVTRTIEVLRRLSVRHARNGQSRRNRVLGRAASIVIRVLQFAFPYRSQDKVIAATGKVVAAASLVFGALLLSQLGRGAAALLFVGLGLVVVSAGLALTRSRERGPTGMVLGAMGFVGMGLLGYGAWLDHRVGSILVLLGLFVFWVATWWFSAKAPKWVETAGVAAPGVNVSTTFYAPLSETFQEVMRRFDLDLDAKPGVPYRLATSPVAAGVVLNNVKDRRLVVTMCNPFQVELPTMIVGMSFRAEQDRDGPRTVIQLRQTGMPASDFERVERQWTESLQAWHQELVPERSKRRSSHRRPRGQKHRSKLRRSGPESSDVVDVSDEKLAAPSEKKPV